MKTKLNKFSEFTSKVLPLEADFLSYFQKFEDQEKIQILNNIVASAKHHDINSDFDTAIDKRKYSYVKSWCEHLLHSIDVDHVLEKLLHWEQQILTDNISIADEKELLRYIKKTESSDYNFQKIYDLGRSYRHYLQIRLRYKDYEVVHSFLQKYRTDYEFSRLVNDKLHETTNEIIIDYSQKNRETNLDSLPWLSSLFYNERLDGHNRLLAWIRIVFIAHNTRQYSSIDHIFEHFEKLVTSGKLYSRRIVTNFYSQYLLLYASQQDFKKASYYGYLSVKQKNNDYLYYVNNLAAVLLRDKRPNEALEIIKSSYDKAKTTPNFHNRIGHASYNIFALIDVNRSIQAENFGFVFLTAYKKEIIEYRWHLFFTAYFNAMLLNGNYHEVIKVSNQLKLKERDLKYRVSANYSPSIAWMYGLAMYKNDEININALQDHLNRLMNINASYENTKTTTENLISLTKMILKQDYSKIRL